VEVEPADLYASTLSSQGDAKISAGEQIIDLDTAGSLDPYLFEALVGVLWKKQGYDVSLTPKQSDRGADLIAQKDRETLLIQVKQQTQNLGASPVREVYSAAPYYKNHLGAEVDQLAVVSNAQGFTSGAHELAKSNEVTLFARPHLTDLLDHHQVTIREVRRLHASRIEL
jgi:HJR/Mrr/RecB family endonuclease